VLSRQRNIERMAILNNKDFFSNLRTVIEANGEDVAHLFPEDVESVPNLPEEP